MVAAVAPHSARMDDTLARVRPVCSPPEVNDQLEAIWNSGQKCWGSAGLDRGNFSVPHSWEPGGKYKSSPVILPEEISAILPHLKTTAAAEPHLFTAIRLNAQLQFRSAAQCPLAFSTS